MTFSDAGLFKGLSILILAASARAQAPGDRAPLAGVHPGYTLMGVAPAGLQPGVSGMDFLSDGRLAICTWGGDHTKLVPPLKRGEVYILSNVAQEDSSKVTYKKFATGLQEPLGLKVVNDTLYLTERQALAFLADKNGDGVADADEYHKLAAYTDGANRHEFFFGLLYKDGWFYGAHSLSLVNGGSAAVPQPDANRGTYLRVEKATGKTEYISGGAREPFGMTMNPDGEIFSTDVQGTWNPASSFTHVRSGRFYGHPQPGQSPASPFDKMPYNPPAVWLPQSEISNAPGEPVYIPSGQFKGQYFYGDVTYGGIQRVYLENVNGEYQGAVMRFSDGFHGGVSRLKFGPNGDLFVGQIGDPDGNWNSGHKMWGLQKLRPNGKSAFEILSVRSRPKGMELEFTEPVALDAEQTGKYSVKTWCYVRTSAYGGDKLDPAANPRDPSRKASTTDLAIAKVQVDASRKKVYLELPGLVKDEVVYIRLVGLKSATGGSLWSTEAWYTLNAFGTGEPLSNDPTSIAVSSAGALPGGALAIGRAGGSARFRVETTGAYSLEVRDMRGAVAAKFEGRGEGTWELPLKGLSSGLYVASLHAEGGTLAKAFPAY
jgi:hypothetical protein